MRQAATPPSAPRPVSRSGSAPGSGSSKTGPVKQPRKFCVGAPLPLQGRVPHSSKGEPASPWIQEKRMLSAASNPSNGAPGLAAF